MFDIPAAISSVFGFGKTAIDKIWPDANAIEKAKAERFLAELNAEYSAQLAQIQVNAKEAEHPSLFVAGARPAIVWASGFVVILDSLHWLVSYWFPGIPEPNPEFAMFLLTGILGLGGMRSFEKSTGVATKRIK